MKLNKDNCIVSSWDDDLKQIYLEVCTIREEFSKARVIEVPKVWRWYGKQYKVKEVYINSYPSKLVRGQYIVKVPSGCYVYCSDAKDIEYYD